VKEHHATVHTNTGSDSRPPHNRVTRLGTQGCNERHVADFIKTVEPSAMMKTTISILICAALAAPCRAEDAWRLLFNGKDLSGWQSVGSAVWKVDDGVIVGGQDGDPKRSGLLMTKEQFQDFELSLDFMINEHGKYNSGVYLRQTPGKGGRTGYQINIGRGQAEEYTAGIFTDRWLAKGDEHDKIRKPEQWNSLRIRATGGHIVVHLNGMKVSDFEDPNPPERFLQAGSIALQTYGAQGHAGWVKFRNIRIREIK
jgi:hypothetical protein